MENASKALLMAGGVLIAILIIALLVNSFTSISSFQKIKLSEEEQEKIVRFNEQYTKYLGQYVYGTEVVTLQNKHQNDEEVEVIVIGELPDKADSKYDVIGENKEHNVKYYKCKEIGYDDSTGKVNSITFEQIEMSATVEE